MKWVSENLARNTYVNIMAQYRVEYKAYEYPDLTQGYGLINLDSKSLAVKKIYDRRRSG